MKRLLKKIYKLGTYESRNRDEIRGITLSNLISLLGILICFSLFILQGSLIAWDSIAFTSGLIGVLFLVPLIANLKRKNLVSRVFLSFYLPTSIMLASLIGKITNTNLTANFETQYYDYRFFLMISGIVAIVLYDRRHRMWTYISLLYLTIILLAFDPLHNYFGVGYHQTGHRDPTYYFTNVVVFIAFIAQIFSLLILRFSIDRNEDELLNEIEIRKKAEQQSILAKEQAIKADSVKSEFLANISHEIRTPLNGVIGFSDLLMKTRLDKTQYKFMSVLNNSALSLLDIVNDILDFSKSETVELEIKTEMTDLAKIGKQVIESVKLLAEEKGLDLKLNISRKTPRYILADPDRLQQVLVNLVDNALKFTESGMISLDIEPILIEKDKQVTIRFTVKDSGVGIENEDLQRIFGAFVQADNTYTKVKPGVGLGLALSSRLLALMNSKLDVKSEIGKGSTFYFDVSFLTEKRQVENALQL